ncbi:ATP-binding cassette domain-containing protein [Thalassolituus pacificus]|uniref:ATP-binding cassette domain-containing protein n=1 Tax=Thalassolituus pacificus TaxID=2975440 RepID=A0A9X2WHA0_9GAMM|nr:ATP-binding cassette domain-containing protein [Thalassolituus pacificus]MCT7360429.1 ATP-binding cassette domain-containing protein [Thalassolituus pacificus]
MVTPTTLIQASGLGLTRGGAAIVDDVGFSLAAGELVMLVGPNGAGKSTLMNMLAGLLRPDCGVLQFAAADTVSWQRSDWAQRVTLVPQLSPMNFPLSVSEVVQLGGLAHSTSVVELRTQVHEAMQAWDVHYLADRDVRLLSGGEQQRCQLARSWIQVNQADSQLWLLDEPLSALDLRHQQQCMSQIRQLTATGKSVLMVVHDLNLARRYADRVLLLCCGRLVADGPAREVLTAGQVTQTFCVETLLEGDYLHWV